MGNIIDSVTTELDDLLIHLIGYFVVATGFQNDLFRRILDDTHVVPVRNFVREFLKTTSRHRLFVLENINDTSDDRRILYRQGTLLEFKDNTGSF